MPSLKGLFGGKKTDKKSGTAGAAGGAIAATKPVAQSHAGLPTVDHFLNNMVGTKKASKKGAIANIVGMLQGYHEMMDNEISLEGRDSEIGNRFNYEAANKLKALMDDVSTYLFDSSDKVKKSKEYKKFQPALAALLVQAVQILPRLADAGSYITDYLLETNELGRATSVTLANLIESKSSVKYTGHAADTSGDTSYYDSASGDLSAYLSMAKTVTEENGDGDIITKRVGVDADSIDKMRGVEGRIKAVDSMPMPEIDYLKSDKKDKMLIELYRIIEAIDNLDYQTSGTKKGQKEFSDRNMIRIHYTEIMKLIMGAIDEIELQAEDDMPPVVKNKLLLYRLVNMEKNTTVGAVIDALDKKLEADAYEVQDDEIQKGGQQSVVYIGNTVHRGSKRTDAANPKTEKERILRQGSLTGSYDEALHKLAEAIGCSDVIASAESTKFKDKNKKMIYGSNMEKGTGKDAGTVFSQGDLFGDGKIKGHGLFDSTDEASIKMNTSMLKLQIVDYIAQHSDRHTGNFMIDEDSMKITAIDNDNSFGAIAGQVGYERRYVDDGVGLGERGGDLETFNAITTEIKSLIDGISLSKVDKAIKPYVNQKQRKMVAHRIKLLKAYIYTNSKVLDISTADGMREYRKEQLGVAMRNLMKESIVGKGSIGLQFVMMNTDIYNLMLNSFMFTNKHNKVSSVPAVTKYVEELCSTAEDKKHYFGSEELADQFLTNLKSGKIRIS